MAKTPHTNPLARWTAPLQAAYSRLAPREQRALSLAAWVVGLGLLWWLAVAPALNTLRQAPERHARLDEQLGQMRSMAATAESLRAQNSARPMNRDDVLRALEQATTGLAGTAQLAVALKGADDDMVDLCLATMSKRAQRSGSAYTSFAVAFSRFFF